MCYVDKFFIHYNYEISNVEYVPQTVIQKQIYVYKKRGS